MVRAEESQNTSTAESPDRWRGQGQAMTSLNFDEIHIFK